MRVCQRCGTGWPEETLSCGACGADLTTDAGPSAVVDADFDQKAERERFQATYGIDIGDRTVGEYLEYLERVDYTLSIWFWLVVGAEAALVGLLAYSVVGPAGWELFPVLLLLSVLLSSAIYADTAIVGLFETRSKTRWVYIGFALIPYCGQIATFLYLVFRRLAREQTDRERRRLVESGFDV